MASAGDGHVAYLFVSIRDQGHCILAKLQGAQLVHGAVCVQQRAQAKQSELLQATLQERMQECTFRPQTNHAKRQQALSEMLNQQELASV